ncbi:MAG: hypothetical protein AAF908_07935 [Pseudomonadota bacterium]
MGRALTRASEWAGFRAALSTARANADDWQSAHPYQEAKLTALRADLARAEATPRPTGPRPWDQLWRWAEASLSEEGQEALLAALLEPHGHLIDDLAEQMGADEDAAFPIDGAMACEDLQRLIGQNYAWALTPRYEGAAAARFWYVSEEKLEPRLGERATEHGAERELPLAVGRDVARLAADLGTQRGSVAHFLLDQPEHRHALRRVQMSATRPYAEIRDNLIGAEMMPVDLLRAKLSIFGATRFDPRSDRWLRICLFQGAPLPEELPHARDRALAG